MTTKTFRAYIDDHQEEVDPKFVARLVASGENISSLTRLTQFARQRWPDHHHDDPRKNTGMVLGLGAMRKLWADYLKWVEEADTD
jgi:hypothetical protein